MANLKHLAVLKQGVEVWNRWRSENPEIYPDLYLAHLLNAKLRGINFESANLSSAELEGVDLRKANLRNANFSKTDLSKSELVEADFSNSNMQGAYLGFSNCMFAKFNNVDASNAQFAEADLSNTEGNKANFSYADLKKSDLKNANFKRATLYKANLDGADLSDSDFSNADFSDSDLSSMRFRRAILTGAILINAKLSGSDLSNANLLHANLSGAVFPGADFRRANLENANLTGADLWGNILFKANFKNANLSGANLMNSTLVETDLSSAILVNCKIYGISCWNIKIDEKTIQSNLVITKDNESIITVDNLKVAQFIYLILNNPDLRDVMDTITGKAVLILGRFTKERLEVLNAIADELRKNNLLPIIFNFDKPTQRDFSETIMTLAGMCKFVIVDITNPKSSPLELQLTVPNYMIPFIPIIEEGEKPFSMFQDLQNKFDWVAPVREYKNKMILISGMKKQIIKPADDLREMLRKKKDNPIKVIKMSSSKRSQKKTK